MGRMVTLSMVIVAGGCREDARRRRRGGCECANDDTFLSVCCGHVDVVAKGRRAGSIRVQIVHL